MNLSGIPKLNELQALFSACDDNAASHILWVDRKGEVFVSPLLGELSPLGFEESQASMFIRYETNELGNEYVGPKAAENVEHVQRMFNSLVKEWKYYSTTTAKGPFYIDSF